MTPKTLQSSANPTNRAQIERTFCKTALQVRCLQQFNGAAVLGRGAAANIEQLT